LIKTDIYNCDYSIEITEEESFLSKTENKGLSIKRMAEYCKLMNAYTLKILRLFKLFNTNIDDANNILYDVLHKSRVLLYYLVPELNNNYEVNNSYNELSKNTKEKIEELIEKSIKAGYEKKMKELEEENRKNELLDELWYKTEEIKKVLEDLMNE
jgi:hypothetical protein